MTAKIKIRQYRYVIFIKPQKFDTADIKCFIVFFIVKYVVVLFIFCLFCFISAKVSKVLTFWDAWKPLIFHLSQMKT